MSVRKFIGWSLLGAGLLIGGFPCAAVFFPKIWPYGNQDAAEAFGTLLFIIGGVLLYSASKNNA